MKENLRSEIRKEKVGKSCRYCHSTANITRDHIIPLSRGGKNTKENIQWLCLRCNNNKSNLTDKEIAKLFHWFKDIENSRLNPLNW